MREHSLADRDRYLPLEASDAGLAPRLAAVLDDVGKSETQHAITPTLKHKTTCHSDIGSGTVLEIAHVFGGEAVCQMSEVPLPFRLPVPCLQSRRRNSGAGLQ